MTLIMCVDVSREGCFVYAACGVLLPEEKLPRLLLSPSLIAKVSNLVHVPNLTP